MASPNSKTILIVTVVLFLGVVASFLGAWQWMRYSLAASDLRGFWEGSISVRDTALRLVLKVDKSPDGNYTATMDSVDQGAKDIPVNTLTVSNGTVRFRLASLQADYHGDLNRPAAEMSGEWNQAGVSLPLKLKRTKNPSTIAGPLPATTYAARQDSPLQGAWKGTINAGGIPLRIVVKISATAPGKFTGTLDSPDQGSRNMPLTTIEFTPPTARFELAGISAHYEGTLKDDASEIDGNWTQAGKDFPLLLKRADSAEDSVPESAYTFASDKELQGFWQGALNIKGNKLRLVLKIAKVADGSYSATLDSPDQGAKDISATTITFADSHVELEWKALRALFHGTLENGKLSGFWQQGPSDFPLDFERTNHVVNTSAVKEKN